MVVVVVGMVVGNNGKGFRCYVSPVSGIDKIDRVCSHLFGT